MGGRGTDIGRGNGGGGGGGINTTSERSLVSERERHRTEVDQALAALRYVKDKWGVDVEDAQVVKIKGRGANSTMAYYDYGENIAINEPYFDANKMTEAYDRCVKSGFHPKRGKTPAIEATIAHEAGHRLTAVIAERMGLNKGRNVGGSWFLHDAADRIVKDAMKKTSYKSIKEFRSKVSGYANENNAEAIAEAYADVYCNGRRAARESRLIWNEASKYLS